MVYDKLVKRLSSAAKVKYGARVSVERELLAQAADAIEQLQKKYDGAVSDNKSLCRQIAELAKKRNEAYSDWMLLINAEPPRDGIA